MGSRNLVLAIVLVLTVQLANGRAQNKTRPPAKVEGTIKRLDWDNKTITLSVVHIEYENIGTRIQPAYVPKKGGIKVVEETFRLDGGVAVRFTQLPKLTDTDGNPRKPTIAEIQKLRGSGRLPGYGGSAADVKREQRVTLYRRDQGDVYLIVVDGAALGIPE